MRWISWRHNPRPEPENRGDLPKKPEITVVIESDSDLSSSEPRGVIVSPTPVSEPERWLPRRRHRSATMPLLQAHSEPPPEPPLKGLASVLQCSRKLLRGLCHGSTGEDRVAYFTRGAYTSSGLQALRLSAPAITVFIEQQRAQSPILLPQTSASLQALPARKEE
jgi:hypothetical protein